MAEKKSSRPPHRPKRRRDVGFGLFLIIALALLVPAAGYVLTLDHTVRAQFEGKRWELPARVYARPLELFQGMRFGPEQLAAELSDLGYKRAATLGSPGSYTRRGGEFRFVTRAFTFWDTAQSPVPVRAVFDGGTLVTLKNAVKNTPLDLIRLQPLLIGSIYPLHHQDRVLVQLPDVPPLLIKALIAVEDHRFYQHPGIDPYSIARALLANVRAGVTVQGGSTLTQQLVKNFYLNSERTLWRKINEAIMAVLLEAHYSKDEILEAYLNEIFLGQEGQRSIHGFGLASQFYFGRALQELELPEIALLVGLPRGASYYDPRRHPERVLAKRNQVLDTLAARGVISAQQAASAKNAPLGVTPKVPSGTSRYPAFLDLVQRQLQHDYKEEDLRSEGLQIFTTFDPRVQASVEQALAKRIVHLERQYKVPIGQLEGAALVTGSENGEILAIVGGRDARFSGFNRALDAMRPIGSLIKPAIYLTALAQPREYTLSTLLYDGPLTLKNPGGAPWSPENYDHQRHGDVPLHTALAHSYNLSTAHLGLELGIPKVLKTLQDLGVSRTFPAYPSTLLGAIDMTPLEVTQMYQTLASGGFRVPLRAIREVLAAKGEPLQRYALSIEQAFDPAPVFLLTTALREVVTSGTARALNQQMPPDLTVAGKTGTTDDLRDSWFAGFSGEHLAVVWLGRDDNRSTGLSGATGALKVWGDIMGSIATQPLQLAPPADIEFVEIDAHSSLRADQGCGEPVNLPFIKGSAPGISAPCATEAKSDNLSQPIHDTFDWLKEILR